IVGHAVVKSGVDFDSASKEAFDTALKNANIAPSQIAFTVSTGYGRKNVCFSNQAKTEITCHARGAHFYFPEDKILIDIGGQDSKVIKIGSDGNILNFKMNRKCAAGTGMFLEEIASRLGLDISSLEQLAEKSTVEIELGSFCTVFTQTEILARIREGVKVEDLIKGAFKSIVKRIIEMDTLTGKIVLTGGVIAYNKLIAEILSERLEREVAVPPLPQFAGAFGAAIIAMEMNQK
ncbi:MAG: acyl-CoA dehydratase activase, partial [Planctomycetota bacterium]